MATMRMAARKVTSGGAEAEDISGGKGSGGGDGSGGSRSRGGGGLSTRDNAEAKDVDATAGATPVEAGGKDGRSADRENVERGCEARASIVRHAPPHHFRLVRRAAAY